MTTVLIPTKNRPDKLLRCVGSLPVSVRVSIHATCEKDLPRAILDRTNTTISFGPENVVSAFNLLAQSSAGNVLYASDDAEFTPDCIPEAEAALLTARHMVGLKVVNMKANKDAFALVGREMIQERGHLFDPRFIHFFSDTELGLYAERRGLFVHCPTAHIINHHPSSSGEYDATHRDLRMVKWRHDKKVWDSIRGISPAQQPPTPQT